MKTFAISLFTFLGLLSSTKLTAQNVAINSTGSSADASAMVDISSTTAGFLMPRMTTAQQNSITLPAKGLTIFNTTLNTITMNTGTSLSPVWSPITSGSIDTSSIANFSVKVRSLFSGTAPITFSNGLIGITQSGASTNGFLSSTDWNTFNNKANAANVWAITGNAGTSSSNFLGTTDNKSLRFRTNNIQRMIVDSVGSVGIGTSPTFMTGSDRELLLVDGGSSTVTNTLINAVGNNNDYLQINVQNLSNGGFASSDVVATANNGSLSTVYIDMGINSNAYNNGNGNILNGSNSAYLYATGNNFYVGNGAQNKDLVFFTNSGATGPNGTEKMRIDATGNIGIGTGTPKSTLDVIGSKGGSITTTTGNITLDATNYTVVITGGTPTITLPGASGVNRRIYIIVNQTGTPRTTSSYIDFSGGSTTSIAANSSVTLQSNGSSWYRIQ